MKRDNQKAKIVIVGGGFAGAYCAQALEKKISGKDAEVILLDRNNYFVFSPLLIDLSFALLKYELHVVARCYYCFVFHVTMPRLVNRPLHTSHQLAGVFLFSHTIIQFQWLKLPLIFRHTGQAVPASKTTPRRLPCKASSPVPAHPP